MSTDKEESVSLIQSHRISLWHCKPKYRLKWLRQKGAILIVIWSFLVNSVFHFLALGLQLNTPSTSSNDGEHFHDLIAHSSPTGIILIGSSLLFPIGGWLADSFLGRYKTIRYSTWIMWITTVTITVYQILTELVLTEVSSEVSIAVFALLYVILCIGLGGFQANIIQLGIDQLTEASSTEITSFITSYVFTLFSSGVAFYFVVVVHTCNPGVTDPEWSSLLTMLYIAVCLTLAVSLDFIFGSCLIKEHIPITTNSVSLIARVVKFAFGNRKRSLGGVAHILDVAKHNFGGPFKNEHVEYVKTFFRMLVIIAIVTVIGSQIIVLSYAKLDLQRRFSDWKAKTCLAQISIRYSNYLFGTMFILMYEIVIHPLCNTCLPAIGTKGLALISIFLSFLRVLGFLGIEIGSFLEQPTRNITDAVTKSCVYSGKPDIPFSSLWMLALQSIEGLYSLVLIFSGYTFMWAQAPSSMKGLVIGMMYAFLGLNATLQSAISAPFLFIRYIPWTRASLSCGICFYTIQVVIVFTTLVVFISLVKAYKESQRSELRLNTVSNESDDEP